uniref:Uncharacterized protein n=1 Tax=termite gut metagenome TaxID=433724 RepID=S0DFJ6_9ZZZZ
MLLTVLAAVAVTGCKKGDDPVPADAYAAFKADDTPRWENGSVVEKNEEGAYTFVTDAGGKLFSSAAYKTGRISHGGDSFEIIEFSGSPVVGSPSDPTIRKPAGTTDLYLLEIVKMEGGKLWIVFKETPTSTERRIVQ